MQLCQSSQYLRFIKILMKYYFKETIIYSTKKPIKKIIYIFVAINAAIVNRNIIKHF